MGLWWYEMNACGTIRQRCDDHSIAAPLFSTHEMFEVEPQCVVYSVNAGVSFSGAR